MNLITCSRMLVPDPRIDHDKVPCSNRVAVQYEPFDVRRSDIPAGWTRVVMTSPSLLMIQFFCPDHKPKEFVI
jgi:hypothetical protein